MNLPTVRSKLVQTFSLLAALAVANAALAEDKHIDITVQDMGGYHKLVFERSLCPANPEPGCIMVEKGNPSPMLSWQIGGPSAADWQFVGLQFSPDGMSWGSLPLSDCTVAAFALSDSDTYSGNASTAQIVAGGKRIQIRNRNDQPCITHYKLSARSNSGEVVDSDPIVDNRGSN